MVSDDDVSFVAVSSYQPTSEELVHAIREAKSLNQEFGVKRILGLLKDKGWIISEQRVKKVMQEVGLTEIRTTEIRTANAPDSGSKDEIKTTEEKATQSVRRFFLLFFSLLS